MISISNGGVMYNRYGITGVYFVDETMPVLDSKHDPVSIIYGTEYHIPTKAQLQELKNNTTHELVTNYNGISNLNGLLFTSIINGNELFFPLSGIYKDGNNEQINIESEILSNELMNSNSFQIIKTDKITESELRELCDKYNICIASMYNILRRAGLVKSSIEKLKLLEELLKNNLDFIEQNNE